MNSSMVVRDDAFLHIGLFGSSWGTKSCITYR